MLNEYYIVNWLECYEDGSDSAETIGVEWSPVTGEPSDDDDDDDNETAIEVDSFSFVAVLMDISNYKYTIAFDGNGADEGEMESIEATFNEEYTLTANTFTREGYTFIGWNTEADGSGTSYEDGETVCNLTTTDGDTITLYAQWVKITTFSIPAKVLSLDDYSTGLCGVEFSLFELICEDDSHDHMSDEDLIDVNNYDTSCWELFGTYTSDETTGEFTLEDLDIAKEYRLVETKTVEDYLVPEGQWIISFSGFEIQISTELNVGGVMASVTDEFTIIYSIECEDGTYLNLCSDEDGVYYINGYSEDEIISDEIALSHGDEYVFYIMEVPSGSYTIHVIGVDSDEYVALCNIEVQVGIDDDSELVSAGTYKIETDITAYRGVVLDTGNTSTYTETGIELNDYDITTSMIESYLPIYVLDYALEDVLIISAIGNPPAVTLSNETLYLYNSSSYDLPLTGLFGTSDFYKIGTILIAFGLCVIVIAKLRLRKRKVSLGKIGSLKNSVHSARRIIDNWDKKK